MGMYDNITCKYPLPVKGANDLSYQTKSMSDWPSLEDYEIREDGTLWVEEYDIEDRGKKDGTPLERFLGCATRVNQRWVKTNFTGEVRFYTSTEDRKWIEWSTYFIDGRLRHDPILITHKERE